MLSGYNTNSSNKNFLLCPTVKFQSQAVTAQVTEAHGWYHPRIYPVVDYISDLLQAMW